MVSGCGLTVIHVDIVNLLIKLTTVGAIDMQNDLRGSGIGNLVFNVVRLLNVVSDLVVWLKFRIRID